MEYEIKEKTSSKIVVEVKESKGEIENAKKDAYKKLVNKVKIPGFRQGKAPYEIGAQMIGEDIILEEALDILVNKTLSVILEKEGIYPLTHPDVHVDELSGESVKYRVEAEFLPEVQVDLVKKYEVPISIKVSEEEIEAKLKELQDSFTEITPVNRAIQKGDFVEVQYKKENEEVVPFTAIAGEDKVIGNFAEQILNRNINDKFEVNTESSKIVFQVNSIKEKHIPKVDDSFAKTAGFEDLQVLKSEIKKNIEENKKLQAEEQKGKEVLKKMVADLNVELPQKFIQEETEERYKDIVERYAKKGKKIEEVLKAEGKTVDEFKETLKHDIERELKEDLVIRYVVKNKEISVADDEIEREFKRIITEEGLQGRNVKLTDEIKRYLRNELLRSKAIEILKENAIIIFGGD